MALITLLSDYGDSDHYVAAVKATILSSAPSAQIIDISHQVQKFHLPHAAYLLQSVFRDFPNGTIHVASVNSPSSSRERFIALELESHFFIGIDNGLFSLISEKKPAQIVHINSTENQSIFPGKFVLSPAAAALANGASLTQLGPPLEAIRMMLNRQLRATRNQIIGHVIHIDSYGNLITNIKKKEFDALGTGRPFNVKFSRESVDKISPSYFSGEHGDCCVVFNSSGHLEIAISNGNASELFGMHFDSPVMVNFVGE